MHVCAGSGSLSVINVCAHISQATELWPVEKLVG